MSTTLENAASESSIISVRGSEMTDRRVSDSFDKRSSVGGGSSKSEYSTATSIDSGFVSEEPSPTGMEAWDKLKAGKLEGGPVKDVSSHTEVVRPSTLSSGKSPRKATRQSDSSGTQPPNKKECLSYADQPGPSRPINIQQSSLTGLQGSSLGSQNQTTPSSLRQIPISPESLFANAAGLHGGLPGGIQGGLGGLGGAGGMSQNAQLIQQNRLFLQLLERFQLLEQQSAMNWLQLITAGGGAGAAGGSMLGALGGGSSLYQLADQLQQQHNRNNGGGMALGGGMTSTPNKPLPTQSKLGKMHVAGSVSGLNSSRLSSSSGYQTDSSFNTSAENSLHELVSKIALQGPNQGQSLNDTLGTSGVFTDSGSLELLRDSRWTNQSYIEPSSSYGGSSGNLIAVDQLAENHRKSAASSEATCTWVGQLPPKNTKNPLYSCKVFLGGVPWDITELQLQQQFKQFGPVTVDWPGKDKNHSKNPPSGYVYLIFENEKAIKALLNSCTNDFSNSNGTGLGQNASGEYYYKLSSKRTRSKEVQVIPWAVGDSNYSRVPQGARCETTRTVFVGALHGMLNAEALASIMNDLFGGVTFAGIDTDKYKYPIGSGRVAFNNDRSYMKAVSAGFIEIKANKFNKKVQVDPYLDDHLCSQCQQVQGQYFCREVMCFTYYCLPCWNWHHSIEAYKPHVPLTRNSKVKNNIVPPVTAVNNMPATNFGIMQGEHHGDTSRDNGINGITPASTSAAFQSAPGGVGVGVGGAAGGLGSLGGCEGVNLTTMLANMASGGGLGSGGNMSCGGTAGLFQNSGNNLAATIEAMN